MRKKTPKICVRATAIVPAAGQSTRMGYDKICTPLSGVPVIVRTCFALASSASIEGIIIAVEPGREKEVQHICEKWKTPKITAVVAGGASRIESVENALHVVPTASEYVVVHDCARPCVTPDVIDKACAVALKYGASVVAHRMTDTVKKTNRWGYVRETLDRRIIWRAATPQVIKRDVFLKAYAHYHKTAHTMPITDDVQLVELYGAKVVCVESNPENIKLTLPHEWALAREYFHRYDTMRPRA